MPQPSETFRRELQQESQQWRSEGLISDEQFQHLAQRYQFATLETAARDRFVMILLGLGSVLVGIGAITFVAANWQALSQTLKAGLMFVAMMGANLAGFALMHRTTFPDRWSRLGRALFLLGALLLGANLALVGQMVHTSGTRYELCLAWAVGVTAMAYGLRLPFLGNFAILLLGIGYWSALWDILWLQNSRLGMWSLQTMPLIAAALFLPLAYRCQSSLLFLFTAIAATSSLFVLLVDIGEVLPPLLLALGLMMPFALLWAYDDTLWTILQKGRSRLFPRSPNPATEAAVLPSRPFQPLARGLMLFALSLFYWFFSFRDVWLASPPWDEIRRAGVTAGGAGWVGLTLLLFAGWTVLSWIWLGWRSPQRWRWDRTSTVTLLMLLTTALLVWLALTHGPVAFLATLVMNGLLAWLSISMIRDGLATGARPPFWWGIVMLTLQILSRVLEYETGLLVKSMVFVGCGVGIIVVGLWFERHIRTLRGRLL